MMNKYEQTMTARYGERYTRYRAAFTSDQMDNDLEFPLQIDLDLIDICNLKCPACHSIGRKRNSRPMDRDVLRQIIQECDQHGLPAINIGGCGEPLLNMELTQATLNGLKNTSVMDVFLHTNGLLLNQDTARDLISAGVTYLCVSIDAVSQEVYQQMRGAELSRVVNNIETFLSLREGSLPALRVSFLATTLNNHEKDRFIEFWRDKADIVDLQNYYRSYSIQPDIALTEQITERQPVYHRREKRISIVAPDYLCLTCGGLDVEEAITRGDTLKKFKTIKNYWDSLYRAADM